MPLPSKQIVQSLSVQNQTLVDDAQIRNQLIVIREHCLNRLRIGVWFSSFASCCSTHLGTEPAILSGAA